MTSPPMRLMAGWREALVEHKASCPRGYPVVSMTEEQLERVRQVVGKISYRDWKVITFIDGKGIGRMQLYALIPCSTTGKPIENYSIPLALCPDMSDGLLVDLVFELVKEYEIHEAAERFSIGGARVYFPHRPDGMPLFEVPSMRGAPSIPPPAPGEGGETK